MSQCAQTSSNVGSQMYKISDTVRSTHGQDGAIVLDIRQGQMFNLNFVGSRILELLKTGCPQSEVIDTIAQEFSVSRDRVENDLDKFFQTLHEHHIVEGPGTNSTH